MRPFASLCLRVVGFLLVGALALPVALRAQVMTVTDAKAEPVYVESATIRTEVTGRLALTTFDLVFRNPNARVLEGSLEFPLLDGQQIVRFALDINGVLREAVPVEKTRARVVFEEIERRQVDPGLIEQTAGNNYRARVYPIPASGTRRIVLAYQEDLGISATPAVYRLALNFPHRLKRFALTTAVISGSAEPPKVRSTLPLEWPNWQDQRVLTVQKSDFRAQGLLEIELPPGERPAQVSQAYQGEHYFYSELPLPSFRPKPRPMPRTIGLLWDASGSGQARDHAREQVLLAAWFAQVPNVDVVVVALRDQAAPPVAFRVRDGDWSSLRTHLDQMVYDGASSFDGVRDVPGVDEWILFSDGLFNYGESSGHRALPLGSPVHTVLSAASADPAFLRGLAGQHAGEFVNLLTNDPDTAAQRLRQHSLRVLSIERDPQAVAQMFPERGAPLPDGPLVVTGQLRRAEATVRLQIGHDASDARWVEARLVQGLNPGELAARAWAVTKLNALQVNAAKNREDIRRTSQKFGIVTGDTSLLVLETLEDYIRYDIAPPAELQEAWQTRQRQEQRAADKGRQQHLDQVAHWLAQRVAWWERAFPKGPAPAEKPKEHRATTSRQAAIVALPSPAAPAAADSELAVELSAFSVSEARAAATLAGRRDRAQALHQRFAAAAASAPPNDNPVADATGGSAIRLSRWSPNAGYLDRLRRATEVDRYPIYLEEQASHADQPAFYLDVAHFFFEAGDETQALRILSNLAELGLEDAALFRVLAHRLMQAQKPRLAQPLFEKVLAFRSDEPHSRRDLALACAAAGDHQRAVDLLWDVVAQPWDNRFQQIELIALGELNAIVATCGKPLDLARMDQRLLRNLPVGLRVVLSWDANDCDIDLWVDDPNGERAFYGHPLTYQGGHMSRDFTQGYGPEEFLLRDPKPGKYVVRINYFGDRRQTALGPVTAHVRIFTGFGTPQQKEEVLTVRLSQRSEALEIGEIEIGGPRKR